MIDKYVGGEKMARNGGKMAKRKICVLFKFPDFSKLINRQYIQRKTGL